MGPKDNRETPFMAPARRRACPLALTLAVALGFGAPAARAQDMVTTPADALILTPLVLVKGDDLIFGDIVRPAGAGTVILTPTPIASCATTGGLVRVGTCQAASFSGWGAADQVVRINLPNAPITISNGAQTMTISPRTFDGDPNLSHVSGNPNANGSVRYRIVSSDGTFSFRIGGTLNVGANQAPGQYTGTFTVTVAYQ